jgi:type I site-specific restriction endonuclease
VSEGLLGQIKCDGSKILKENLSAEENEYRKKQGGDARLRRTDILLFPAEAKCIIIELKAPDANVSDHLNQINRYASLINNLSIDTLKFNTFYGYLVGESIDADDIIDNDSDFMNASNLGYIFRPYKRIVGKFGRVDGSLYTEIIKYSTLLERAKLRNKIFIDKLK